MSTRDYGELPFPRELAFPRQHAVADANDPAFKVGSDGMTLRDYFAAKALAGMLARTHHLEDVAAEAAYVYADAMLAERAK